MSTEYDEEDETTYEPPQPQLRASRTSHAVPVGERATEPVAPPPGRPRRLPRYWPSFLLGALIVVGVVLFYQQVMVPTTDWLNTQWHYGDSRLTQLDADVGHGGPSHFLAEYYNHAIVIVELPVAHPDHDQAYVIPAEAGRQQPVITLRVVQDPRTGRADLVVHAEALGVEMVLYNTGTSFSMQPE